MLSCAWNEKIKEKGDCIISANTDYKEDSSSSPTVSYAWGSLSYLVKISFHSETCRQYAQYGI